MYDKEGVEIPAILKYVTQTPWALIILLPVINEFKYISEIKNFT
jgi:hypothetical protein